MPDNKHTTGLIKAYTKSTKNTPMQEDRQLTCKQQIYIQEQGRYE